MTIVRSRVACAAVLVSLALAYPARAEEALVKGLRAEAQEMSDDGDRSEYHVPFSPVKDAAVLRAYTTRVTLGQRDDRGLIRVFATELGQGELVIRVDNPRAARPGVYHVEIEVAGRPPGGGAEVTQLVNVELTRPEGVLRPPPALVIERTIALFGADTMVPRELALVETSERSMLRDLRLEQLDGAAADDGPNLGKLGFDGPHLVPAGGMKKATIEVSQPFPPGTSRGAITARSPEMKDVTFTYEIRSRRPRWLVLPIFLFGSLIGWFYRVLLKRREQNLALRVSAEEIADELDEEIKTDPEPDVQLGSARRRLDAAVAAQDPIALAREVEAAEAALKTTRAARENARQVMLVRVRDQLKALGAPWMLPPSISTAEVTRLFEAARQKTFDDDLAGALKLEREATPVLRRVAADARRWAEEVSHELQQLAVGLPPSLADDVQKSMATVGLAAGAAVALAAGDPTTALPPAATEALLHGLHDANRGVVELVERLCSHVPGANVPDRADVKASLRSLSSAFHAMDDAEREALRSLQKPATKGFSWPLAEPTDSSEDAPSPPRTTAAPPPPAGAAMGGPPPLTALPPGPPPVPTKPPSAREQLAGTRSLMTAISAVIMSISALALYGENFFGTQKEILGLLAVAFTSDFTVVAALEAVTKARKT